MSYWIYSPEAIPNPKMMGKPRYTPEYIQVNGVTLPLIPEREWMKLPDSFNTKFHKDWRDKQGTDVEVSIRRFKGIIESRFADRGVIFLDHEPSKAEKEKLEPLVEELNLDYRKRMVEFFESNRQRAIQMNGTLDPTPYIDECYDILHMSKPYSFRALQAQRDPGREAADKIAEAIKSGLEPAITAIQEAMTRPQSQPAKA